MKRETVFILVQIVLLLISVILTDGFIHSNEVVMRLGDPPIVYDMAIKENDKHEFQFQFNGEKIEILHHGIKDPTNADSGIGKKKL